MHHKINNRKQIMRATLFKVKYIYLYISFQFNAFLRNGFFYCLTVASLQEMQLNAENQRNDIFLYGSEKKKKTRRTSIYAKILEKLDCNRCEAMFLLKSFGFRTNRFSSFHRQINDDFFSIHFF